MKYRSDFVTNSSSSSFVIAYRTDKGFDSETLGKYPFLKNYTNLIEGVLLAENDCGWSETDRGHVFKSEKAYEEFFLDYFGYKNFEEMEDEEPGLVNHYNECVKYLRDGFNILHKNVDYSDGLFRGIIDNMVDTGEVVLIDCD